MVVYHYALIGVICMVIFHVFIIKNYPNLFSNYYPKYTIRVLYPFILNLGEFIYEVHFPEHYPIIREEKSVFSYCHITSLIEIQSFLIRNLINFFYNNMYVRKRQYYHRLGIILLIKTMIYVFLFVVITTLIRFKFSITATPNAMM